MGQKTIPELDALTAIDENTLFIIDDGIQTYKITGDNLAASLRALTSKVVSKNSNYGMAVTDGMVKATGAITITLPDATQCPNREFLIKKMDSGTTTSIAFTSGQSADDETSLSLTEQFSFFNFKSNGVGFDLIAWG
jgi:hypothetical protein